MWIRSNPSINQHSRAENLTRSTSRFGTPLLFFQAWSSFVLFVLELMGIAVVPLTGGSRTTCAFHGGKVGTGSCERIEVKKRALKRLLIHSQDDLIRSRWPLSQCHLLGGWTFLSNSSATPLCCGYSTHLFELLKGARVLSDTRYFIGSRCDSSKARHSFVSLNSGDSLIEPRKRGVSLPKGLDTVTRVPVRQANSRALKLQRVNVMAQYGDVRIENGSLLVYGSAILSSVPDNIVLTADANSQLKNGAFLGFRSSVSSDSHTVPIGVFNGLRFMCCFRFKLWWMTQRMGTSGSEVPLETQFLLVESSVSTPLGDGMDWDSRNDTVYTVFLPLLEGSFRTSLQGNTQNQIEICVASGDPASRTSDGLHSVYLLSGPDPFEVISEAVRAVEGHMQSFTRRVKKKMPGILDYFGWCTWDAFYTDVTAEGVMQGLKSLAEGGAPARFLIIDDGWQSVAADKPVNSTVTEGTQYSSRLKAIRENEKFLKDGKSFGLHHIVPSVKDIFNVKFVYVWHALAGYWGGVQPDGEGMEEYGSVVTYPVHTPGVLENQPDMAIDSLTINGLGLVNPKKVAKFFDELHSYLRTAGVDGVKVDAQSILETLGAGFGGRVSITKQFHLALEESIAKNFPDNGCIACMSHNTDSIYSSNQTAVVRASDDFWPRDPASHTIHIASVAYNTLFLGEFMQPDWDMFQSLHPAAEYHAAARVVGGCSVYVSDKPGYHNFDLLRKIVLPDGRVLRAQLPGRPTLDSLFSDPARDGVSLLKIWNMNLFGGVLGVFNCQGAGWCKINKKNSIHETAPLAVTGSVSAADVHFLAKVADGDWKGDCILYSHRGEELTRLPRGATIPLTLKVLEFEIFTVSPLKSLAPGMFFAPIGLIDMFNSGGAIESLVYEVLDHELLSMYNTTGESEPIEGLNENMTWSKDLNYPTSSRNTEVPLALVRMRIKGCGVFGAYSSKLPRLVCINCENAEFSYDFGSGLLKFILPVAETGDSWDVIVEV